MDASHYNHLIYSEEGKFDAYYHTLFENRTRKILEMMHGFEGRFLDVGCGDGTLAKKVQETFPCRVDAVELIPECVQQAREKGLNVKQVDLNKEQLPYEESTFDAILAGEVAEHLIDSEGFIADVKRTLKPRGILILTVPNIAAWYNRILMMFGYVPHWVEAGSTKAYGTPFGEVNGHVKAFTEKAVVEMLGDYGFKIVQIRGSGFSPAVKEGEGAATSPLMRMGSRLFFAGENLFSRRSSLASNILVKAVNH